MIRSHQPIYNRQELLLLWSSSCYHLRISIFYGWLCYNLRSLLVLVSHNSFSPLCHYSLRISVTQNLLCDYCWIIEKRLNLQIICCLCDIDACNAMSLHCCNPFACKWKKGRCMIYKTVLLDIFCWYSVLQILRLQTQNVHWYTFSSPGGDLVLAAHCFHAPRSLELFHKNHFVIVPIIGIHPSCLNGTWLSLRFHFMRTILASVSLSGCKIFWIFYLLFCVVEWIKIVVSWAVVSVDKILAMAM